MPRNLVICCDGTNNQFGPADENTNVVRLVQILDRDPEKQRLYYDPGVGTLPEPGAVGWLGRRLSDLAGLAFGSGLLWKVEQAYTYLMNYWERGDRVFVFGFSRGAYTGRVLAALLHELGLLPRGNENLVPYVLRLFKTAKKDHRFGKPAKDRSGYWELRDDFRMTFSRPVSEGDEDRRFPIHFMGLWDTVSSVGWVWDPAKFPFTTHNPSVGIVRHAVSIDERRAFFRQNLMGQEGDQQNLEQLWFPGVHCDVGGGYERSKGLWRLSFDWIIAEATKAGLAVDSVRLQAVLGAPPPQHPWTDEQHESLTPLWWLAEFFPKLCWSERYGCRLPSLGLGRNRYVKDGNLLAEPTLRRIRDSGYRPRNLPSNVIEQILALGEIPRTFPVKRVTS